MNAESAAPGTFDSYVYGNNMADSGTPSAMFPTHERVRYVSRVVAIGSNWVQFERPLIYDIFTRWKVKLDGPALPYCVALVCILLF